MFRSLDSQTQLAFAQPIAAINPDTQRRASEQLRHEIEQAATNYALRVKLIVANKALVGVINVGVFAQHGDLRVGRQRRIDRNFYIDRPDRIMARLDESAVPLPCGREFRLRFCALRHLVGEREQVNRRTCKGLGITVPCVVFFAVLKAHHTPQLTMMEHRHVE